MFRKHKQIYFYVLSFLLPIIFLNLIFNLKHMYPFGSYSLLQEDLNYQYINYLSYFRDSLLSGNIENFLYSFSMSIGSTMSGLDSYYFMNPLFIILHLFKSTHILLAIYIISNLSIGLMGISMLFYCLHSKIHRTNLFFSLVLSISYALMSYNLAYLSNLMWLTNIIMLPLICYGVEKIIFENKGKCFFISLSFSILFNYYIG
ncbi:MAG: YfhO family protein, partial [Bacillus sp. (in: firmicutes)]